MLLGGYQQEGKSKFYNDETENIPDEEREGASRTVLDNSNLFKPRVYIKGDEKVFFKVFQGKVFWF